MIKALFFDLDGTLLNSRKTISPLTKSTLTSCKEAGIKIFIATARPPILERVLSWDRNTMSLFEGGSYHNGGCVVAGGTKEYMPIPAGLVQDVIEIVSQQDRLNIVLQLEDEFHAFRFTLKMENYESWGVTFAEALTLDDARHLNTIKMLIFYEDLIDSVTLLQDKLVQSVETLCRDKAQFYLTDRGKAIQVTANGVNKLRSIEKICRLYGYAESEIAVFGDDMNDMEMLSAFEYSFAMGNAHEEIKRSAKYTTLDNDSDGIHHAIKDTLKLI